jgi:hypothetical protein
MDTAGITCLTSFIRFTPSHRSGNLLEGGLLEEPAPVHAGLRNLLWKVEIVLVEETVKPNWGGNE